MKWNPSNWDWELMVFLNNLSPDALDQFWSYITYTKHWLPLFILIILLFFYKPQIKKSLLKIFILFSCVGVTHLFTEYTKYLVQRDRPNVTEGLMGLLKILYEPSNYSFFSGHASTSFAASVFVYLTLASKFKYLGLIFIWPVFFSLSRIFVGVHFPSDVIVGAFVGTILGILGHQLYVFSEEKLLSVGN